MPRRPRLLIVEDEVLVCDALAVALGDDHELLCARTGEAACALLSAGGLDGLLLAYRLPEGPADAVLREADRRGVPALVATGDPLALARLEGQGRPVLAKPFGLGELRAAVARALARPAPVPARAGRGQAP